MDITTVAGFVGKKLGMKRIAELFAVAAEKAGGTAGLSRIFSETSARSIPEQVRVVERLAAGQVPERVAGTHNRGELSTSDRIKIETAIGRPRLLAAVRENRAFNIFDRAIVGARMLVKDGQTIEGVDLKSIAGWKTKRESQSTTSLPPSSAQTTAAVKVKPAEPPKPAAKKPAPSPAKPAASTAKAAEPKTKPGAMSIREAHRGIVKILGSSSVMELTGDASQDWTALEQAQTRSGFDCPWSDAKAHPVALRLTSTGLARAIHAERSAALRKFFTSNQ